MIFRVLPSVRQAVFETVLRLESEQLGFGIDFAELVEAAYVSITVAPRFYPRTEDGPKQIETREYYIKRFEYRLIYALLADDLVVLALVHARKKPGSWKKRLKELR